jgi:hypothetical protein
VKEACDHLSDIFCTWHRIKTLIRLNREVMPNHWLPPNKEHQQPIYPTFQKLEYGQTHNPVLGEELKIPNLSVPKVLYITRLDGAHGIHLHNIRSNIYRIGERV